MRAKAQNRIGAVTTHPLAKHGSWVGEYNMLKIVLDSLAE
jgi:hypothetical protein